MGIYNSYFYFIIVDIPFYSPTEKPITSPVYSASPTIKVTTAATTSLDEADKPSNVAVISGSVVGICLCIISSMLAMVYLRRRRVNPIEVSQCDVHQSLAKNDVNVELVEKGGKIDNRFVGL